MGLIFGIIVGWFSIPIFCAAASAAGTIAQAVSRLKLKSAKRLGRTERMAQLLYGDEKHPLGRLKVVEPPRPDLICRCGREYYAAGFPNQCQCGCGRTIYFLAPGDCYVLSETAARGVDAMEMFDGLIEDNDTAASICVASYVKPRDMEPGELSAARVVAEQLKQFPNRERDETRRIARMLRPKRIER